MQIIRCKDCQKAVHYEDYKKITVVYGICESCQAAMKIKKESK